MQDFLVRFHPEGRLPAIAVMAYYGCLNLVIFLQAIAVEEFEYYAVYETNAWDLGMSFLMFKPFEYVCEVLLALLMTRLEIDQAALK